MSKSLLLTFKTTHQTMKAHRQLKHEFNSDVIPAPEVLSESGCKIALYIPDASNKKMALEKLKTINVNIIKLIEMEKLDLN